MQTLEEDAIDLQIVLPFISYLTTCDKAAWDIFTTQRFVMDKCSFRISKKMCFIQYSICSPPRRQVVLPLFENRPSFSAHCPANWKFYFQVLLRYIHRMALVKLLLDQLLLMSQPSWIEFFVAWNFVCLDCSAYTCWGIQAMSDFTKLVLYSISICNAF